jgi:hypothetical protein
MHCNGNLEVRKLVSDAITVLSLAAVDLLVWKPLIFMSVHKNYGYIKPTTTVGKSGYKWKTMETFGKTRVGHGLLY